MLFSNKRVIYMYTTMQHEHFTIVTRSNNYTISIFGRKVVVVAVVAVVSHFFRKSFDPCQKGK